MDDSENQLQRALFIHLSFQRDDSPVAPWGCVLYGDCGSAGNSHLLQHRKWVEVHMTTAVDLVYNTFGKIEKKRKLMLQDSFIIEKHLGSRLWLKE